VKTIRALVNELVRREGLKKQVEIAQVRELVGHLSDIMYEWINGLDTNLSLLRVLYENGRRRAKKKGKK
jgi:hypothetical protein